MILETLKPLELESLKRKIPIIGPEKGSFLLKIVNEVKPRSILELGTANGYSGIILASKGAILTTIEKNPEIAKEAEKNFKEFNIKANIIIGNGVTEIKKLNNTYDLIFIDFTKKSYIKVLEDCIKRTKIIIADNIRFLECQDFKRAVLTHPKLETKIIDIKDGLSLSIVKS